MKKRKQRVMDWTDSDLPSQRREQFPDIFKERFGTLFCLALLCFLFALSEIFVSFLHHYHLALAREGIDPSDTQLLNGIIRQSNLLYGGFEALGFGVFFVLFSGVAQILRQLIWGEPIFFKEDFFHGIKSNGVSFFFIALFVALFEFVISVAFQGIVYDVLHALLVIVFLGIALWMGALTLFYPLSPAQLFLNGFKFFVRCFPVTFLMELGLTLPFYLISRFAVDFLLTYLLYAVAVILFIVPLFLAFFLYAVSRFDRYINKEKFPDYYRKGLSKDKAE